MNRGGSDNNGEGNGSGNDSNGGYSQGGVTVYNNGGEGNSDGDVDPYTDFRIDQCDTYSNLWLWDLSMTCESTASTKNCDCAFASELMDLGMLSCEDAPNCPRNNCQVCNTCLKLLGCTNVPNNPSELSISFGRSNISFFVVAAAIASLVVAGVVYGVTHDSDENALEAYLIDDDAGAPPDSEPGETPVWLVPTNPPDMSGSSEVDAYFASTDDRTPQPNIGADRVWLAPA
jgi:hypothetical protein